MIKEIEDAKEIFLSQDVDEESRSDNLELINQWERSLIESENFISWREHDVTQQIFAKAKEAYIQYSLSLAQNRKMTDEERKSLFAKQDAVLWIMGLIKQDRESVIEGIKKEIASVLSKI